MDRIRTVSTISRWEIRGGFGRSIISLPTVSNWHLSWSLISLERTELWMENLARLWVIISASAISTWQLFEGRYSSKGQNWNCGFSAIRRYLDINSKIVHWHLPHRYLSVSQRIEIMYEGEGWVRSISRIVWTFEVTASISTRILTSMVHNGRKSCLWQEKIGLIWNTAH